MTLLVRMIWEEDAVTTVEYAVMITMIIGTLLTVLTTTGKEFSVVWNTINTDLDNSW